MRHAQPKQYFAATHRAVSNAAQADAIEWEELPSLAASLAKRLVRRDPPPARGANDSDFMASASFSSPWDNTLPAALDMVPPSQPFVEKLEGLAIREVNEPGVFHHFFGAGAEA